ncbi:hypothetical protein [Streptomyces sp. ISL-10]|nr:hypothetical protein [Streptomyces sp. ISL-10]
MLAQEYDGPHRDRTSDAWWVTPEIADAVSVSLLARVLADAFVQPERDQ